MRVTLSCSEPSTRLVSDLCKPRDAGCERLLAIGVVEKCSVGQAWPDDTFVTGAYLVRVAAFNIADRYESCE